MPDIWLGYKPSASINQPFCSSRTQCGHSPAVLTVPKGWTSEEQFLWTSGLMVLIEHVYKRQQFASAIQSLVCRNLGDWLENANPEKTGSSVPPVYDLNKSSPKIRTFGDTPGTKRIEMCCCHWSIALFFFIILLMLTTFLLFLKFFLQWTKKKSTFLKVL